LLSRRGFGDVRGVALVHDYLLVMRGAERTFAAIADRWPDAPIHTTLFDGEGTCGRFDGRDVRTSWLQRFGVRQSGFRRLLPAFPKAVESLDLSDASVVISSSSAFAHGVRVPEGAVHVSYCHSPFRYVWHERERALAEIPIWGRAALDQLLRRVQRWDLARAAEVTQYVANSQLTRRRIQDFYGRDCRVVHPPVEIDRFAPGEPEDWFLMVGELVDHKCAEVALEGARRAGVRVKVVGDGPARARLAARFQNAEFLGRVSDWTLTDLYARARALLVANVEEFGITAVESQASGRPVVAPAHGGARETVLDGVTGILLETPTSDAFAEVLREVDFDNFWTQAVVGNAERFSVHAFQDGMAHEVNLALGVAEPAAPVPLRIAA
jgi:glycosyltransferase involved in cell wall biosynthesis